MTAFTPSVPKLPGPSDSSVRTNAQLSERAIARVSEIVSPPQSSLRPPML